MKRKINKVVLAIVAIITIVGAFQINSSKAQVVPTASQDVELLM